MTFITESDVELARQKYPVMGFGELGAVVDIRTYRRFLADEKRREDAYERNARVTNYNIGLAATYNPSLSSEYLKKEADEMFEFMCRLLAMPSGRAMWVGGTRTTELNPSGVFNCSSLAINRMSAFSTLFELLMMGTGVGFRVFQKDIEQLPSIKQLPKIELKPYTPVAKEARLEHTDIKIVKDYTHRTVTSKQYVPKSRVAKFLNLWNKLFNGNFCSTTVEVEYDYHYHVTVGDSRQGWIDALSVLLNVSAQSGKALITYNFDSVRPKGERIYGFGGTASGHDALETMIRDVWDILSDLVSEGYSKLRSIDCMDICCAIAKGVVAGSSRRSALICLFEEGDDLCASAKKGLYTNPELYKKQYRIQSNNTECIGSSNIETLRQFLEAFPDPTDEQVEEWLAMTMPTEEWLASRMESVKAEGEPGFNNYWAMIVKVWKSVRKYRPEVAVHHIWSSYCDLGTNPCFAPGTLIITKDGTFPIEDLVGIEVEVYDGNRWITIDTFRITGTDEPVYDVTLHSGQKITATANHTFILEDGTRKQLKDLEEGDRLLSHDVFSHGTEKVKGAYLKGFLMGDGSSSNVPILNLYEPKYGCADRLVESCLELPVEHLYRNTVTAPGFREPVGNRKFMSGLGCRKYSLMPWVTDYRRSLPYEILNWDYQSKLEFIAGYMDADGTASDTRNGFMYQISSINRKCLEMFQLLLQSIGVYSTLRPIKPSTKTPGYSDFGKDRGGVCAVQPVYRLTINQSAAIKLSSQVNFCRLSSFADKTISYNLKNNNTKVSSITFRGVEKEVYCCTVPGTHAVALGVGIIAGQCSEILLNVGYASPSEPFKETGKGVGFCNLTTLPMDKFVENGKLNYALLEQAIKRTVHIGCNQTCVDFPREELDATQREERLLGIDATGWQRCFALLGWTAYSPEVPELLQWMNKVANEEATEYSKVLGIKRPLRVTTCKPNGTASKVLGTTSDGIHYEWAPYYIRRIEISSRDALAITLVKQGFPYIPKPGSLDALNAEEFSNCSTTWERESVWRTLSKERKYELSKECSELLFEFPVSSGAQRTSGNVSLEEQFTNMLNFTKYYVDHMVSSTITVKDEEWKKVPELIRSNWKDFINTSFFPYWAGGLPLMPYEQITEERYTELLAEVPSKYVEVDEQGRVTFKVATESLAKVEAALLEDGVDIDEIDLSPGCATGACPIR